MIMQVQLSLNKVSKAFQRYDGPLVVLNEFTLEIFNSEFISIFGPNGCGKSTLLHIIAGIIEPDSGAVNIAQHYEADHQIGIVFQNYDKSLLPWRTCLDNIALPLEGSANISARERKERVTSVLKELNIQLPLSHYPYEMSGGQKQLTCIARAMIQQPSLLLLDEPFASLDYQTRLEMQTKLQEIWEKTQVTTIFISHEIDEAIFLADRLILLTARPAHIASQFHVQFPRPRQIGELSSTTFINLRAEILRVFMKEVKK
jgi:NitT/TauT family transport system ATP-binding protein